MRSVSGFVNRFTRRALREIYGALTAAGWFWIGLPTHVSPLGRPVHRLEQPPQGHPERLCPDVALTSTELALQRQLLAPTWEHQ